MEDGDAALSILEDTQSNDDAEVLGQYPHTKGSNATVDGSSLRKP